MIVGGYLSSWLSGPYLIILLDSPYYIRRGDISKSIALIYFILNFTTLVTIPIVWTKITSSISILFYIYLAEILFGPQLGGLFDIILGNTFLLYSIMTKMLDIPFFVSSSLEISSMLSFFGAGVILFTARIETEKIYKITIAIFGTIIFSLLFYSSFETPLTKGYLPLLGSLVASFAASVFMQDHQHTFFKELTFRRILQKQVLPLAGCALVAISPFF